MRSTQQPPPHIRSGAFGLLVASMIAGGLAVVAMPWIMFAGHLHLAISLVSVCMLIVLTLSMRMFVWRSRLRARLRENEGKICPGCGYDLRGLDTTGNCPECGRPFHGEADVAYWRRHVNF